MRSSIGVIQFMIESKVFCRKCDNGQFCRLFKTQTFHSPPPPLFSSLLCDDDHARELYIELSYQYLVVCVCVFTSKNETKKITVESVFQRPKRKKMANDLICFDSFSFVKVNKQQKIFSDRQSNVKFD